MNNSPPTKTLGLRHVALYVDDLKSCENFYVKLLGMRVEWRPDDENIYLTSGQDNLALHKRKHALGDVQRLDHIGFILESPEIVDQWYDYFCKHSVPIKQAPKTHRDGARSFYCTDPDGTLVQLIYHPPIAIQKT